MYVTREEAIRSSSAGANNFPTLKERLSSTLMASFNFRDIQLKSMLCFTQCSSSITSRASNTVPMSVGLLSCERQNSFSVALRKPMFRKQSTPAVSPGHRIVCVQAVEELPPKLQNIVKLFQEEPETRAKFTQVLQYGKNMKGLVNEFKIKENKVEGCASRVWVRAFMDDKKVYYEADSDSGLARGVAALLVEGLSGCSPAQIMGVTPDFIEMLGCAQRSTPSRNNGFVNTLKLMQRKALRLYMEAESAADSSQIQYAEQIR